MMQLNSNYSDDIRSWDHDYRSPFYIDPGCEICSDDTGACDCAEIEQGEREAYEELKNDN